MKISYLLAVQLLISTVVQAANHQVNPYQNQVFLESLSTAEFKALKSVSSIPYVYNPDKAPFEWQNAEYQHAGMIAEIIELLEQNTGIDFVDIPSHSLRDAMNKLRVQQAKMFTAMESKPNNHSELRFTNEPICVYSAVIVGDFEDRQVYLNLGNDAQNKLIGVVKNSALAQYLMHQYPKNNFLEVESSEQGFQLVDQGRIDLFATDEISARYFIEKRGFPDLKISLKLDYLYQYKIALHKSIASDELISVLDKALKSINAQKQNQIYNNWKNIKAEPSTDWDAVLAVSLFGLALFTYLLWKTFDLTLIIRQKTLELAENEGFYQNLIDTTGTGFAVFDPLGNVVTANDEYVRLSGHKKLDEIVGRKATAWIVKNDRAVFVQAIQTCLERGAIKAVDIECIGEGNHLIPVEINASVVKHKNKVEVMALCRDISVRKRNERNLEKLAKSDDLTGLSNRRELVLGIQREFDRAKRYASEFTIMVFDLDYFKKINDQHGHQAGDSVLKEVAVIIKDALRTTDFVGRYGGEEFIVVMPETSVKEGVVLAKRLCELVASTTIAVGAGERLDVTISGGVANYPTHANSWEELISAADNAMYQAKAQGRNQVQVVHSGLSVQQKQLGLTLD